jgi:hypothetical protein
MSLETMHTFTKKQLGVTKPIGLLRDKYEERLRQKDEIIANQALQIETLSDKLTQLRKRKAE